MVFSQIYNFLKADGNLQETKYFIKHPMSVVYIVCAYLLLVKWVIPKMMKDRKPYNLRWVIVTHSLLLSAANAYLAFYGLKFVADVWNIRCEMIHFPKEYDHYLKVGVHGTWNAWLMKFPELLDTVFFALRKKDSQITFLHLFHHSFLILVWLNIYLQPQVPFYAFPASSINLTVHVVMYLYYGLAAIGPHMQKYLWWKKYLTMMQITQFIIILGTALYGFLTGCEAGDSAAIFLFVFVAIILLLFLNFYAKSYKTPSSKRVKF